jgi:glycosyltransferase involved in cell wall biosynthesis
MNENVAAYLSSAPSALRFCRHYMKWLYFPMFDHHIAVSRHVAEELTEASHGHRVRRGVWVMPMGVDCARFSPARKSAAGRARLLALAGVSEGTRVLLYSGRLAPEKNVMLLLDMMARLKSAEFRLVIAGDGILLEEMRRLATERDLSQVTFLGFLGDRDLLADLCAGADMFVHPNPREPFGIAPLEAMASGTPLLVPDCGGVLSYADHSNAWLARPHAEAFASAVRSAAAEPELRQQRAQAARRTAENFEWSKITDRFLDLYRDLAVAAPQHDSLSVPPSFWSTPGDIWGREIVR